MKISKTTTQPPTTQPPLTLDNIRVIYANKQYQTAKVTAGGILECEMHNEHGSVLTAGESTLQDLLDTFREHLEFPDPEGKIISATLSYTNGTTLDVTTVKSQFKVGGCILMSPQDFGDLLRKATPIASSVVIAPEIS
jgi:hypothetical protein